MFIVFFVVIIIFVQYTFCGIMCIQYTSFLSSFPSFLPYSSLVVADFYFKKKYKEEEKIFLERMNAIFETSRIDAFLFVFRAKMLTHQFYYQKKRRKEEEKLNVVHENAKKRKNREIIFFLQQSGGSDVHSNWRHSEFIYTKRKKRKTKMKERSGGEANLQHDKDDLYECDRWRKIRIAKEEEFIFIRNCSMTTTTKTIKVKNKFCQE